MLLTAEEEIALAKDLQRIGVFFRIATVPVVGLWMGIGNIKPGVNVIDTVGITYKGLGEIVDVPVLSQLINGQADRVECILSGALPLESMIGVTQVDVRGKECAIGVSFFDLDWQLLGPVRWLRKGKADSLSASQAETSDPNQPIVRTISLSIGSLMTNRRRVGLSYMTDYDQKRRSDILNPAGTPDRFCERTTGYSINHSKTWPRF